MDVTEIKEYTEVTESQIVATTDVSDIDDQPVRNNTQSQNVKWYQDLKNLSTVLAGLFVGTVAGGLAGTGIDSLGWYKGAYLGAAVGTITSGTSVMADELHASEQTKSMALLAAGGLLAGTAGMLMTRHGMIVVSEAVGAGVMAALLALCMAGSDEDSGSGQIIAGASIAGALAGASEATKVIAGGVIGGGISLMAKIAQVGYGNVRLLHARDGVLLGGFIGKIFEASGAIGDSESFEVIKEAGLAGAGLGAVVGAVYAEKLRQDRIARDEEDLTRMSSLRAGLTIGAAAAAGGYLTNLAFRHIVPFFADKYSGDRLDLM